MKKIEDCSYVELLKRKKTNQIAATTLTSILSFLVVALKKLSLCRQFGLL